jgi:hypothetical protein
VRDRGGAVEDLASAVIISQNNLSLVPLCVRSNLSQVQSDRISRHFTGRPFVMLRHAGIAAGDALARNASRATGARSVSMLCVPTPRIVARGRASGGGTPHPALFFPTREETRPHQRRHGAPNTPRSLTRTPEPHLHIPRTQILDGSVWCVHVSPPPRPPNQTLEAQHHALLPTADELKYAIINR